MSNHSNRTFNENVIEEVVRLSKHAEEVGKRLESALITQNVDGQSELKKYIRKQLAATEQDGQTRHVQVLDSNGFADLIIEKFNEQPFAQVKCDYQSGAIDWQSCKDVETLYIHRDYGSKGTNFYPMRDEAVSHGIKNIIPTISYAIQCYELANFMIRENQVTGNPAGVFFPHAYSPEQTTKLVQIYGYIAESIARIGGAVAVEREFGEVISGQRSVEEVLKTIAESISERRLLEYGGSATLTALAAVPSGSYDFLSGGISTSIPSPMPVCFLLPLDIGVKQFYEDCIKQAKANKK